MKQYLIFFLIIWQHASVQTQCLPYVDYSRMDGLPSNNLTSLVEDNRGFLWIGSDKGISRFDGNRFLNFIADDNNAGLTGQFFKILHVDEKGNLWINARNNGLFIFDTHRKKVINHFQKDRSNHSLPGNNVSLIFRSSDGVLWLGVDNIGLCRFNPEGDTFHAIPTFTDPDALLKQNNFQLIFNNSAMQDQRNQEVVWISTLYGLLKFNYKKQSCTYIFQDEPQKIFGGRQTIHIDGVIYAGTYGKGVILANPNLNHLEYIGADQKKFVSAVSDMGDGRHLLIQSNYGLEILDLADKKAKIIKSLKGFTKQSQILKTSNGLMWVASYGDGLLKIQPKNILKGACIHEGQFIQVAKKGDILYGLSNDGHLHLFNKNLKHLRKIALPIVNSEEKVVKLKISEDQKIFVLTYYHVYSFDEQTNKFIAVNNKEWNQIIKEANYFWDFSFTKNHDIYISTQDGGILVLNMDGQNYRWIRSSPGEKNRLYDHYSIGFLTKDQGEHIWGSNGSIFTMDTLGEVHQTGPTFMTDTINVTLNALPLYAVDENKVITCTEKGDWIIFMYKNEEIKLSEMIVGKFKTGTKPKGIYYDRENNVAMAYGKWGVVTLKLSDKKQNMFHFGHGLQNVNHMMKSVNETFIIASDDGLLQWEFDTINRESQTISSLYLDGFRIFDKVAEAATTSLDKISLHHTQNFFSFEYGVMDYYSDLPAAFEYKLEGIDAHWVDAGFRQYAGYTNLNGGEYTFNLRRKQHEDEILQVKIAVSTPFWKTWWFIIFILAMGGSLIMLWYRYRIAIIRKNALKESEMNQRISELELKALRSQMNPHFIFNSLNAIKYYVVKKDPETAADYLSDFSKLIRLILNNSNQKLIPLKDEITAVKLYLQIENLRFDKGFGFDVIVDENIDEESFMVPPLLFQPYIENSIWHGLMHKKSGHAEILVRITKIKDGIECTIRDNGIGRDKAAEVKSKSMEKNKSYGLTLTRNRMNLSEETLDMAFEEKILDLTDPEGMPCGTEVIIKIVKKWTQK